MTEGYLFVLSVYPDSVSGRDQGVIRGRIFERVQQSSLDTFPHQLHGTVDH